MDIEDLVYGAGKKGRTKDGKSLKVHRQEVVQDARMAVNLKKILEGKDHSALTRAMDAGSDLNKGKSPGKLLSNKEVATSAMASVNLMEDYTGVSPSDIAAFRSANPLLGDFGTELMESYEYAERKAASSQTATSADNLKAKKKSKKTKDDSAQYVQMRTEDAAPQDIDKDGNLVSVPSSSSVANTQRRKSLGELDYLYRAQVVKSVQSAPETKRYKEIAEEIRLSRSKGPVSSLQVSLDDGSGGLASSSSASLNKDKETPCSIRKKGEKKEKENDKDKGGGRSKGSKQGGHDVNKYTKKEAENLQRRRWRYVEKTDDQRRREGRLRASLIRMFEVQVEVEEEAKKQKQKKKQKKKNQRSSSSSSSLDLLSLFRRSFSHSRSSSGGDSSTGDAGQVKEESEREKKRKEEDEEGGGVETVQEGAVPSSSLLHHLPKLF